MTKVLYPTKQISHNSKLNRCRSASGFLRQVTSPLCYGTKTPEGPRYVLRKRWLETYYADRGYGKCWSRDEFDSHCGGRHTLYFMGADHWRTRYRLIMIDVDVMKAGGKGTVEGGQALRDDLAQRFAGSYWESSTNGKGQHGYLLLDCVNATVADVREGMRNLEAALNEYATGRYDVEMVEIKGGPPTVHHYTGREISIEKYGSLAKLPRGATLEQLQNLPAIFPQAVLLDKASLVESSKAEVKLVEVTKAEVALVSGGRGSTSFDITTTLDLDRLEEFATQTIVHESVIMAGVCRKVSARDFAIALAILCWTRQHPNDDGSQPVARIRALWSQLVEQGIADRSFSGEKWAVIYRTLTEQGHLEVRDEYYVIGHPGSKGKAMRWDIGEGLVDLIETYLSGVSKSKKEEEDLYTQCAKDGDVSPLSSLGPIDLQTLFQNILGEHPTRYPQAIWTLEIPWLDPYVDYTFAA